MSRLTKKDSSMKTYMHTYSDENKQFVVYDLCQKLGKLEDILEEYSIEDLTDLKIALDYYNHRFDGLHTERVDNNKETPMKVVKWKLAQPETRCAKCGAGLERKHDYCWGCGRKVDWSDSE